MNTAPPRLMSVTEAAETLGVSRAWLNQSRLSGKGPIFMKIGNRCLYDPADLTTWLAGRRRSSTSDAGQGVHPHA